MTRHGQGRSAGSGTHTIFPSLPACPQAAPSSGVPWDESLSIADNDLQKARQ
jgi:hypothetical protein